MFTVPFQYAFLTFIMLTFLVWGVAYYSANQPLRQSQLWISRFGLVGGPLINWAYYQDFW